MELRGQTDFMRPAPLAPAEYTALPSTSSDGISSLILPGSTGICVQSIGGALCGN